MRRSFALGLSALGLCALLSAGGCTLNKSGSESGAAPSQAATPPPPLENYFDFNDVAVPQDMKLSSSDSFILETANIKTGVMVFTGQIEAPSLRQYYINTMAKDGWTMRSAIKSSKSILLFEKPGKYAVVIITDGTLKTRLEIWVTPQSGAVGEGSFSGGMSGTTLKK